MYNDNRTLGLYFEEGWGIMRYKILLTGRDEEAKEEYFFELKDYYEIITSSCIDEDLLSHINYFRPDIIMVCLGNLTEDDYTSFIEVDRAINREDRIPIVIIGTSEEAAEFKGETNAIEELVLNSSFPIFAIKSQLDTFFKKVSKKSDDMPGLGTKPLVRRKILVIDDSSLMLKVIRENLHDRYDVTVVTSGELALNFLETKTVDLIILDYDMPVMSGTEVFAKLRDNKKTRGIPVIFLTGVTDRQKISKALKMGPKGYLLKPIDINRLLKLIAECIG